eukprot:6259093-Alexandrium_andersonii.AAC.1
MAANAQDEMFDQPGPQGPHSGANDTGATQGCARLPGNVATDLAKRHVVARGADWGEAEMGRNT